MFTYSLSPTVTKTWGDHNLRAGYDFCASNGVADPV